VRDEVFSRARVKKRGPADRHPDDPEAGPNTTAGLSFDLKKNSSTFVLARVPFRSPNTTGRGVG
jgi:hypothetical protein